MKLRRQLNTGGCNSFSWGSWWVTENFNFMPRRFDFGSWTYFSRGGGVFFVLRWIFCFLSMTFTIFAGDTRHFVKPMWCWSTTCFLWPFGHVLINASQTAKRAAFMGNKNNMPSSIFNLYASSPWHRTLLYIDQNLEHVEHMQFEKDPNQPFYTKCCQL